MFDKPNNEVIPVTKDVPGLGLKKLINIPVITVNGTKAGISLFTRLSKKEIRN